MAKLTLAEVIQGLREEFSTEKWSRRAVREILESYDSELGDWERFAKFDDHKYYRVVIDCGNDR